MKANQDFFRPMQKVLDPRKNIFDPRNPRKNYDPRKKYLDPRNPRNSRKIDPRNPRTHGPT